MNMNDYKKVTDRIYPSDRCREEVMNMRSEHNRKKIKHRPMGKIIAAISVAVVAACGGTVAAAAKLGAFERLSSKETRTVTNDAGKEFPIDKFDKNDYASIAPAAVKVEKVETASNGDITVSIDSVYCDGQELIFALNGSLDNGNSVGAGYIHCLASLYVNGEQYPNPEGYFENTLGFYGATFVIDEGEQNSFTGSVTCLLSDKNRIAEDSDIELRLFSFKCRDKYWTDSLLVSEPVVSLSTKVTPDTSLVRRFGDNGITVSEDGFSATVYSISPAMMVVSSEHPKWYDENEEKVTWIEDGQEMKGPKYAIISKFYDADGNEIKWLERDSWSMPDGKIGCCLRSTDSDVVYCRFLNKQTGASGEMELIKELRIDLSE